MGSFYCSPNNKEKMGQPTILSVIHMVTIDTMLNFNGGNYGHGLTLRLNTHFKGPSTLSDIFTARKEVGAR